MLNSLTSTVIDRPFADEADWWRVRDLLLATYPITPTGWNWEIRRWDGWRFHREQTAITSRWGERLHLWETSDGQLVGVAHPEGDGEVFLELHPAYRFLEESMLMWAETHLSLTDAEGQRLDMAVHDYDMPRRRILTERGYTMLPYTIMVRRMRLTFQPLPLQTIAEYEICPTQAHPDDYAKMAALLNAGFGRTTHTAAEYAQFATHSPSFQHEWNLVAVAADGTWGAHVGFTYDEVNQRVVVEPVCTHPDHRRRGLGRALIVEGLRRLQAIGAQDAYVDTGDDVAANALYDAVGFTEAYQGHIWRKRFLA